MLPEKGPGSVPFSIEKSRSLAEDPTLAVFGALNSYSYGKFVYKPTYLGLFDIEKSESAFLAEDASGLGKTMPLYAAELSSKRADLTKFDTILMMLPDLAKGYPICEAYTSPINVKTADGFVKIGMAWLAGKDSSCYVRPLMIHELGHTLGMNHSGKINCDSENRIAPDLADPTFCGNLENALYFSTGDVDIMGSYRGHPNVFWKKLIGWLDEEEIAKVEGSGIVTLDAFEVKSNGYKGIEVPLNQMIAGEHVNYWLEYRTQEIIDLLNGSIFRPKMDEIQIRLNMPIENDFERMNTIIFSKIESGDFKGMALRKPGDSFTDVYNGIKFTWDKKNTELGLDKAVVSVQRSDIKVNLSELGSLGRARA